MATAFDRYGEALGLWKVNVEPDAEPFDLKLQMGDGRELRTILMDERNKKDKESLFKNFENFMFKIIKRDFPNTKDEAIKGFTELNIMRLFDEAQITFRFTTREELEKAKQETLKETKKLIEGN